MRDQNLVLLLRVSLKQMTDGIPRATRAECGHNVSNKRTEEARLGKVLEFR